MKTWISLLRGINVGGKNIIPMKTLRQIMDELGYENVQTYIQSGNCVFESGESSSSAISKNIAQAIEEHSGFSPSVITISTAQLLDAVRHNPFDIEKNEPKSIHFYFLSQAPTTANMDALQKLKHPSEEYSLAKSVFYLLTPQGMARSKLAAGAESKIGVSATARNYRTIMKLVDLAT